MKKLMLGNEALARGLYEAGVRVVSSYPGTPSTEITQFLSEYSEIKSEWAPNEKVSMEVALGASIGGARAFCAMKHVGLNVAADPLFTASYTGVNGGMVIVVADDQGMHSSQNEQDSRHYAIAAKLPMLEPSDSMECYQFAKIAFDLSEEFDTPVIIRLSTRISHSQSMVETGERQEVALREYKKDVAKYVMMPAMARARHVVVENRTKDLAKWAENCPVNSFISGNRKIGVISAGIAFQYAFEALGDNASYLKLGMVNPLPDKLIRDFASSVDSVVVIEELDDVLETAVIKMGLKCEGKALFSPLGEYTARQIAKVLLDKEAPVLKSEIAAPVRPPVLCPGCPHRGIFYILSKLKLMVSGDIGCYTMGAQAPLSAMDTCVCMGASVSLLHGFNKAREEEGSFNKSVAVIGDSTFMHSGMTSLVDIIYNKGNSKVLILDNSITGMTGHQDNPTTGLTIKGEPTYAVDLEALCRALGVPDVRITDPNDLAACEAELKAILAHDQPAVLIVRRPCALLKTVKAQPALRVDAEQCIGCKMCLRIGCPSIKMENGKSVINQTLCVGCNLCQQVCPKKAIMEQGASK